MKNYKEKEKKLELVLKKLSTMSNRVVKMSKDIDSLNLEKNQLLREKVESEKNFKSLLKQHQELKSELEKIDKDVNINFNPNISANFKFDHYQISRVCFNLIKNSIESLKEKSKKTSNFAKNIDIEIVDHIDYISLTIIDSGIGFKNIKTSELTKPYFTT